MGKEDGDTPSSPTRLPSIHESSKPDQLSPITPFFFFLIKKVTVLFWLQAALNVNTGRNHLVPCRRAAALHAKRQRAVAGLLSIPISTRLASGSNPQQHLPDKQDGASCMRVFLAGGLQATSREGTGMSEDTLGVQVGMDPPQQPENEGLQGTLN